MNIMVTLCILNLLKDASQEDVIELWPPGVFIYVSYTFPFDLEAGPLVLFLVIMCTRDHSGAYRCFNVNVNEPLHSTEHCER